MKVLFLLTIVAALLLATLPGGAQTSSLSVNCTANASGSYSCSILIPSGTSPGRYNLVATCPIGSGSAAYPISTASSGSLIVSTSTIPAGQTLTADGAGCASGATVSFSLVRTGPLALADVFGGVAEAQTATRTNTAAITVTASQAAGTTTPARSRGLSVTGINALPWLATGVAALAVGGAFVFAGRRRIRKTPSASA